MNEMRNLAIINLVLWSLGVLFILVGLIIAKSTQLLSVGVGVLLTGIALSGVLSDESLEVDIKKAVCCDGYKSLAAVALSGLSLGSPTITAIPLEEDKAIIVYSPRVIRDLSSIELGIGIVENTPYIAFVLPIPFPSFEPTVSIRSIIEELYGPVKDIIIEDNNDNIIIRINGIFRKPITHFDSALPAILGSLANFLESPVILESASGEESNIVMVLKSAKKI